MVCPNCKNELSEILYGLVNLDDDDLKKEIDDKELIAKLIPLFIEASKEEIDV